MPIIFMGGGASLMKQAVAKGMSLFCPLVIEDVCVNAKGYERLCGGRVP